MSAVPTWRSAVSTRSARSTTRQSSACSKTLTTSNCASQRVHTALSCRSKALEVLQMRILGGLDAFKGDGCDDLPLDCAQETYRRTQMRFKRCSNAVECVQERRPLTLSGMRSASHILMDYDYCTYGVGESSAPYRSLRTRSLAASNQASPRRLGHLETEQLSPFRSGKDWRRCGRSTDSRRCVRFTWWDWIWSRCSR